MEVENPVWGGGGEGGVTPEKLLVVCSPLLKTLTLFMTKVCDFFYPLSVSGFQWPDQKFDTLFKKKHSQVQKPNVISDQNWYPIYDPNGLKTTPFKAARTKNPDGLLHISISPVLGNNLRGQRSALSK